MSGRTIKCLSTEWHYKNKNKIKLWDCLLLKVFVFLSSISDRISGSCSTKQVLVSHQSKSVVSKLKLFYLIYLCLVVCCGIFLIKYIDLGSKKVEKHWIRPSHLSRKCMIFKNKFNIISEIPHLQGVLCWFEITWRVGK